MGTPEEHGRGGERQRARGPSPAPAVGKSDKEDSLSEHDKPEPGLYERLRRERLEHDLKRRFRRDRWEFYANILFIGGSITFLSGLGREWWARLSAGELRVVSDTLAALLNHWMRSLIGIALMGWAWYLLSDVFAVDREREQERRDREQWERWRAFEQEQAARERQRERE